MQAEKNNYKANDNVECDQCNASIKAKDMLRYNGYIYCSDVCLDIVVAKKYSIKIKN